MGKFANSSRVLIIRPMSNLDKTESKWVAIMLFACAAAWMVAAAYVIETRKFWPPELVSKLLFVMPVLCLILTIGLLTKGGDHFTWLHGTAVVVGAIAVIGGALLVLLMVGTYGPGP